MRYETSTVQMIIGQLLPTTLALAHRSDVLLTHTSRTKLGRDLLSQFESQYYYEVLPLSKKLFKQVRKYGEDYPLETVLAFRRGADESQDRCIEDLGYAHSFMHDVYLDLGQVEKAKKIMHDEVIKLILFRQHHSSLYRDKLHFLIEEGTDVDGEVNIALDEHELEFMLI